MRRKLEKEINLVLAGWNPIGVDGHVALVEYKDYIQPIIKALKGEYIRGYLENLLNELGLEYDSENQLQSMEVNNISGVLIKLYQEHSITMN